jgi:hypothetical protein
MIPFGAAHDIAPCVVVPAAIRPAMMAPVAVPPVAAISIIAPVAAIAPFVAIAIIPSIAIAGGSNGGSAQHRGKHQCGGYQLSHRILSLMLSVASSGRMRDLSQRG